MSGKSISADVGRQVIGKGYPVFSWYCIMSGMGIFPDPSDLRLATPPENRYSMEEIDNLLQRSALNFRSQRDVLTNIPKKVEERALQIYFWQPASRAREGECHPWVRSPVMTRRLSLRLSRTYCRMADRATRTWSVAVFRCSLEDRRTWLEVPHSPPHRVR
jgi:hypothetical protein